MHTYLDSRKSTNLKSSSSSESKMILSMDARTTEDVYLQMQVKYLFISSYIAHSLMYFLTLIALLFKFPIIKIFLN